MEIFQELFLTVIISLGLAFLIAKLLISAASTDNDVEQEISLPSKSEQKKKQKEVAEFDEKLVYEERSYVNELKNIGLEIEQRVEEFVEKDVIVDKIEGGCSKGLAEIVAGGGEMLNDGLKFVEVGIIEDKEEVREEIKIVGEEEKFVKKESYRDTEVETGESSEVGGLEDKSIIEKSEKVEVHEIGRIEVAKAEEILPQDEHIEVTSKNEKIQEIKESIQEKSSTDCLFSDEDDWEGIERSEIENLFGVASKFVNSGDNNEVLSKLGSDVQMQLYGLHKVATEGPCYEPQPLALMVSARAKWHAWQRLGNMSPDVAMEQYTALLSESVPGWTGRNAEEESKQNKSFGSSETEVAGMKDRNLTTSFLHHHHQPISVEERKPGDGSSGQAGDRTGG